MSIADEARAEAERRIIEGTLDIAGGWAEDIFAAGAEWQASRKPEAAPSDTDLRELIDVIADRLGEHPKAGNVFDITDEATTMIRLDEGVEVLAEFIAPALVSLLSRTSQPVQVEVTDDMVERLARSLFARTKEGRDGFSWPLNGEHDRQRDMEDARKLLVRVLGAAALGGGE